MRRSSAVWNARYSAELPGTAAWPGAARRPKSVSRSSFSSTAVLSPRLARCRARATPAASSAAVKKTCMNFASAGAVARAQAVQHFPRKMMACRRRVLGAGGGGEVPEPGQDQGALLLLEAVLVLDEFCKELAAITFVKYHHYCTDYS